MSSTKMYTLRSSEDEAFEVSEQVVMMSQTIKHLIIENDDKNSDDGIHLPNVSSAVLAKIIEYCKKHAADGDERAASASRDTSIAGGTVVVDEDLKAWDNEFVQVDPAMVFDLINAANYLNIKELLDLACQAVANMIKGKQPDELRKMFNIVNDFTPEQEAEVRRENSWAFE